MSRWSPKRSIVVVGWLSLMSLAAWVPTTASAAPITYVDANFDSGALDFGFGSAKYPFGRASNISATHLDGRALEFRVDDQMEWVRIDHPESPFHRISFDYYAEAGATLTQFLDVPSILRLDVRMVGRHHIDLEYDLVAKTAQVWIDGVFDGSLLSILAWPLVCRNSAELERLRIPAAYGKANEMSPTAGRDPIQTGLSRETASPKRIARLTPIFGKLALTFRSCNSLFVM